MKPRRRALLDACVLVNFSLCDTLLRLAERFGLFEPLWSQRILDEAVRAMIDKLDWPKPLAVHFEAELRRTFTDSSIAGYDYLIPLMSNHPGDRHVVAAALHGGADLIVTINLRHFPPAALDPIGLAAVHPDRFLCDLLTSHRQEIVSSLAQQAEARGRTTDELLTKLSRIAPSFVNSVRP